jgi:glycosyltransferase involved in cell wall biosynthesis
MLRGLKLETSRGLRRILLRCAEQFASRSAQFVLCNSRSLRDRALGHDLATEEKLLVLGDGSSNGVDICRFSPADSDIRGELGIPAKAPVIGFAGRLTADKGLPELMEAFALLLHAEPEAFLLLVGWFDAAEDGLDRRMRERIESHPRVICTGFVDDTARYYRAMDLMVLPSWREGFPNVVLEPAASGIPVIVANCTGSRDSVINGVTGLLVALGDPAAIRDAALSLLHDHENRKRMAKAARDWVAETYQSRRVLGLTVAFYKSLVRDPKREMATPLGSVTESANGLPVSP